MLNNRRQHLQGQQGFTLIELLVVILIIGILAAIAIPSFLGQTEKASDSNVEAALSTAHSIEATYRVTNGQYAQNTSLSSNAAAAAALTQIESTLSPVISKYNMSFSQYPTTGNGGTATSGYQITATNPTDGVAFGLQYTAATGGVVKSCTPPNTGACNASSAWG